MKFCWNIQCKKALDYSVYLAVRLIICLVQSLSLHKNYEIAVCLAFGLTWIIPFRKKLLNKNLQIAFPDLTRKKRRRLIFQMWKHLFLMGIEVALAPRKIHETTWKNYIELVNVKEVIDVFHVERPLLLVTAHFGNFEMGGYTLGLLGYPTFSVARTLDNPYLDRFIKEFREKTGQYLISKNDGYDDLLNVLEHRGIVAFLSDQSAGPKGCWVEFFQQPASAYKAMALLSHEYNAPMIVCYATRKNDELLHFELQAVGFFDPQENNVKATTAQITQWFTSKIEEGVRAYPDQYWWVHNRWKNYGKKITLHRDKLFLPSINVSDE